VNVWWVRRVTRVARSSFNVSGEGESKFTANRNVDPVLMVQHLQVALGEDDLIATQYRFEAFYLEPSRWKIQIS